MRAPLWFVLAVVAWSSTARSEELRARVQQYRERNEAVIVRELADFVAIPNVNSDTANIGRNAERLVEMLRKRGVAARLLQQPDAPPAVYGELRTPNARRTVVFYAHYDGQPVDPAQWKSPPWTPVLRNQRGEDIPMPATGDSISDEARLYGRSASDDKAPIEAFPSRPCKMCSAPPSSSCRS